MVTWIVFASSWNKVSIYLWASICLLSQQCWKVPVTSEADAELECWVYQCLLEAYQLQPAIVMPVAQVLKAEKGAAAWPTLSSQLMEACAAEATFLLCLLKKPVYSHPKYYCKSILRQPWSWYISFSLGVPKHPCFLIKPVQSLQLVLSK